MRNKKKGINGFTLIEFMLVIMILLIIIVVSVPLILYAIKAFRINAFKNSAYNVLDAARLYVANNNFDQFPAEGLEVSQLDLNLDNNKFDGGLIKKINNDNYELINLSKNNYCARGTTDNMKATDKGCGFLDETAPVSAHIYLKNATSDSLTIVASGVDLESKIVSYEYSIDGSKFMDAIAFDQYTFDNLKPGNHKIKVKVTNEASLSTISDEVVFSTKDISNIECSEKDSLSLYQTEKNFICKYPLGNNFIYQYSLDGKKWEEIKLTDNSYTFNFKENSTIYTRVLKEESVLSVNVINVSNIDKTLNGAYPELLDNMVPIVFDNDKKIWVKADDRILYFDYQNKIWANAALVNRVANTDDPKSHNREYYMSEEAIGNEVYEGDILGYYVWIPRYKYNLFNTNNKTIEAQNINIEFENNNQQKSLGKSSGSYLTHPAFSYEDEINGFWVSKYQNSTSKKSSCYNDKTECDKNGIILYSVPDNNKITNISISNAYLNADDMKKTSNIYGLTSNIKSHVLTNLEWGAIAYLTNSNYGTMNGSILSSTTGNITGVFDMNSNLQEMVMANYNQDSGKDESDNSGFKDYGDIDFPSIIDYYSGITNKNRILGDATSETDGWYDHYSKFVNGEYPFFVRGGVVEGKNSIYNYNSFSGAKNEFITFRTVLSK